MSSFIERLEAVLALGPFQSLHTRTLSAYMTVTLLKIWVTFLDKLLVIRMELRRQSQQQNDAALCSKGELRLLMLLRPDLLLS